MHLCVGVEWERYQQRERGKKSYIDRENAQSVDSEIT